MSELWGGSGPKVSQASLLSPSVLRLRVAYIDFCPLLQKCTINQYSNKSSFILEKCSFQLSGHEVWVLSVWRLTLGLICPTTETWACGASVTGGHTLLAQYKYSLWPWAETFQLYDFHGLFCKPSILSQSQLDDSLELDFCFPQRKNMHDIFKSVTFSELHSGEGWAAELLLLFFNHFNLNLHQICSCCEQAALNMQKQPAVTAHKKSQQQWNRSLLYCNHSYIGNIRPLSSANAWSTDVFFPLFICFWCCWENVIATVMQK